MSVVMSTVVGWGNVHECICRERDEQHVVSGVRYVCVCVWNRGQLGLVQAVPSSETKLKLNLKIE